MSNLNSALGITQLKKIDKIIKIKRNIFQNYKNNFLNNNDIHFIDEPSYAFSNCTYPNIILNRGSKKEGIILLNILINTKFMQEQCFLN